MDIKYSSGVAVIRLPRHVHTGDMWRFEGMLQTALTKSGGRVVVNLTGGSYMASPVVGLLLAQKIRVAGIGGDVKICCAPASVTKLFGIMGITSSFQVFETVQEAIEAFQT